MLLWTPEHLVCLCVFQTGLRGNTILSLLYKGGLLMGSQDMTIGERSSVNCTEIQVLCLLSGEHKFTIKKMYIKTQ